MAIAGDALLRRGPGQAAARTALADGRFVAGLVTIVIALDSPIDTYADQLFWVHMLQHVLLLTVAPPLILSGGRGRGCGARCRSGRGRRSARTWPDRAGPRRFARSRARGRPGSCSTRRSSLWHIPAAYNLTLNTNTVHDLEHAMFFFTGLLFWARVIDPGPLRPRLIWPTRIAYVVSAMVVGWVLAITLVLVPTRSTALRQLATGRAGSPR